MLLILLLSVLFYLSLAINDNKCAFSDGKKKHRQLRMLVTISSNYFDSFINWLVFYYDICGNDLSQLYIFCIDTKADMLLQKYGLKCSYSLQFGDSYKSLNRVWWTRMLLTQELLLKGFDVISSDVDAIWLKNPYTEIAKMPRADIIVTRGKYPEAVSQKYGAALCTGFMYVKTSKTTIELWTNLVNNKSPQFNPDDQRELNRFVAKGKIKFSREPLDYYNSTTTDVGHMRLPAGDLYVALLPQNMFRRECEGVNRREILTSIVVHCGTDKQGASKQVTSSTYGLWKLKANWKSVGFHTFDQFMRDVRVL